MLERVVNKRHVSHFHRKRALIDWLSSNLILISMWSKQTKLKFDGKLPNLSRSWSHRDKGGSRAERELGLRVCLILPFLCVAVSQIASRTAISISSANVLVNRSISASILQSLYNDWDSFWRGGGRRAVGIEITELWQFWNECEEGQLLWNLLHGPY
jgi:hypothetical protein